MSKKKQINSHFTSIVINNETGEVLKEHPIKEKDLIVIKKQFIKLFIDDNVKDIRHQYESFLQSTVMKYIDYKTNKLRILTNQNRHKPLRIKDIAIFLNISHSNLHRDLLHMYNEDCMTSTFFEEDHLYSK